MPKGSISYRKLLSEVQEIQEELTRALKVASPAAQEVIKLDLKQFERIEADVRASCFGVLFVAGRQLPPKPTRGGPTPQRSPK
jgi:hypothetical protein